VALANNSALALLVDITTSGWMYGVDNAAPQDDAHESGPSSAAQRKRSETLTLFIAGFCAAMVRHPVGAPSPCALRPPLQSSQHHQQHPSPAACGLAGRAATPVVSHGRKRSSSATLNSDGLVPSSSKKDEPIDDDDEEEEGEEIDDSFGPVLRGGGLGIGGGGGTHIRPARHPGGASHGDSPRGTAGDPDPPRGASDGALFRSRRDEHFYDDDDDDDDQHHNRHLYYQDGRFTGTLQADEPSSSSSRGPRAHPGEGGPAARSRSRSRSPSLSP
jgi:hypothetical protein